MNSVNGTFSQILLWYRGVYKNVTVPFEKYFQVACWSPCGQYLLFTIENESSLYYLYLNQEQGELFHMEELTLPPSPRTPRYST